MLRKALQSLSVMIKRFRCYNSNGEPIQCPYCFTKSIHWLEARHTNGAVIEATAFCNICKKEIGHYSHGEYDKEYTE